MDRTFMSRLKYLCGRSPRSSRSSVAFEAMMFVHASLKDTVFASLRI